jgi:hypothetical protein
MDLRMSADERWAFVDAPRIGVLTIADGERGPLASPLWYAVVDGAIRFAIGPDSRKAELLGRSRRATLCVQSETMPYGYVTAEGPAVRVGPTDPSFRRELAIAYLGADMGAAYIEMTADEQPETWELQPQRWTSTDYGKLGG